MVWVVIEPVAGGLQRHLSERSFLKWQKVKGSDDPNLRSDGRTQWRIVNRIEDPKGFTPAFVGPKLPEVVKPQLPAELKADVAPAPKPALPDPLVVEEPLDPAGNPVGEPAAEVEKKKPGRPKKA